MISKHSILASTTSSIDGVLVKQYLKPISAHVVAGTGLFTDFLGGLSDLFGGRSVAYQKQLISLYNEATENLKSEAYALGANCILGLRVDMDEISGKGKSMFMITAMGTAVIIDHVEKNDSTSSKIDNRGYITIDNIKILQKKREMLAQAAENKLTLDDETWQFINGNHIHELHAFIFKYLTGCARQRIEEPERYKNTYQRVLTYIDSLPVEQQVALLYATLNESSDKTLIAETLKIIEDLKLLNLDEVEQLLNQENFDKRKLALQLIILDMLFYNEADLEKMKELRKKIENGFGERGQYSTKKQMFSSKEKQIWVCECGKTGDIGNRCSGCDRDIYGFEYKEVTPAAAVAEIDERIDLIEECLRKV